MLKRISIESLLENFPPNLQLDSAKKPSDFASLFDMVKSDKRTLNMLKDFERNEFSSYSSDLEGDYYFYQLRFFNHYTTSFLHLEAGIPDLIGPRYFVPVELYLVSENTLKTVINSNCSIEKKPQDDEDWNVLNKIHSLAKSQVLRELGLDNKDSFGRKMSILKL